MTDVNSIPTATEADVKPKRKYNSTKNVERNAEIVRLFTEEKQTLRMIAEKFGVTHQAISQTLQKSGVNPGEALAARNAEKSASATAKALEKRQAREAARAAGVQKISEMWKAGNSVEDIRVACNMKSIGSTNVKIVLLRRRFPDMFPLRHQKKAAPVVA